MKFFGFLKDELALIKEDFWFNIGNTKLIYNDLRLFAFFTLFYLALLWVNYLLYSLYQWAWEFGILILVLFLILSFFSVVFIYMITLRSISKFGVENSYVVLFARITLHILLFILAFSFIFYFVDEIFPGSYLIWGKSLRWFIDYLYYSAVTFSTVGYGDIVPTNFIAKVFTLIEVLSSYIFMVLIIWNLTNITDQLSKTNKEWYLDAYKDR